ncbi:MULTISPECIES: hypothetical protein [unclassified Sedimentibacter]|uniref:hypothetical protein n=1 Tax=unclassified Sedimentibacter TaxID=2649220 RepID=UPI0027DFD85A|nr:hypothetical protein [Sedimentibacter sp. MB35-C1]WMJ77796.1 hypothetical protein RBQ61_02375 [Sedimentibacter sp. MB35-C1]
MNKNKLYKFSLEIKQLLNNQNTSEAERKIKEADLTQEELDFLFMCLHSDGYDPKTDRFLLFESDNSAFLQLVNLVQSRIKDKK